jgi:hypothetical protein
MHPGGIVPHVERARKEPISLFRVWGYVAKVDLCSLHLLRRASGAFITVNRLHGRLYLSCESRGLLLHLELAHSITIDCDNTVGS